MAARQNIPHEGSSAGHRGASEESGREVLRGRPATTGETRETTPGFGERMKSQVGEKIEAGKERVAGRLDDLGERMEERGRSMEEEGGLKGKVGKAVHRAGDALERGAESVRTSDWQKFRHGLEDRIENHPLLSVGVALGTGFALGRMFKGEKDHEEEESFERFDRGRRMERGYRGERQNGMNLMSQVRGPIGRAVVAGVTALAARRIRERISGQHQAEC